MAPINPKVHFYISTEVSFDAVIGLPGFREAAFKMRGHLHDSNMIVYNAECLDASDYGIAGHTLEKAVATNFVNQLLHFRLYRFRLLGQR
jgi:hypothetical protein